jgi:hypothetical protein
MKKRPLRFSIYIHLKQNEHEGLKVWWDIRRFHRKHSGGKKDC